jgi:hypothetical protein
MRAYSSQIYLGDWFFTGDTITGDVMRGSYFGGSVTARVEILSAIVDSGCGISIGELRVVLLAMNAP